MKGVLGGVLPAFPAQEEYKESLNVDLSPAVTLQPLGNCWLTSGFQTLGPRPGHCSGSLGKGRQSLLPGEAAVS